ncbi:hypothetical protein KU73_19790 [Pectobacterium wasabiae]|uniref:Uncharacterized protein n=1 Tax=Pectobacterium wasabiae TaxID=55208 RepID=A0AAW3ECJ0_9GAMM|nr:hypothetical protein A7983_10590 [Pectobacterium wasabiae CFBP 3304]KFX03383.1 hypothetical protein JV38_19375 [Pectobacterium wasabiae]KGA26729.1 hypothetical protein KU73_19790 [Pectobacterium wasabiae]
MRNPLFLLCDEPVVGSVCRVRCMIVARLIGAKQCKKVKKCAPSDACQQGEKSGIGLKVDVGRITKRGIHL